MIILPVIGFADTKSTETTIKFPILLIYSEDARIVIKYKIADIIKTQKVLYGLHRLERRLSHRKVKNNNIAVLAKSTVKSES